MNRIITGSGNDLSPVRRQAITWTNAELLQIRLLGTSFSEIWIGNLSSSFKKMHLKISSAKMAAILSRGRWVNYTILYDNEVSAIKIVSLVIWITSTAERQCAKRGVCLREAMTRHHYNYSLSFDIYCHLRVHSLVTMAFSHRILYKLPINYEKSIPGSVHK